MTPTLNGIDHIHVNVANWGDAEAWYRRILGFRRVDSLMAWAVDGGPLTIEDPAGKIHLALFESDRPAGADTAAFGADGSAFLAWKDRLEAHGLKLRLSDHRLAYSMYFTDPWGNAFEITTYDRDQVAERLRQSTTGS